MPAGLQPACLLLLAAARHGLYSLALVFSQTSMFREAPHEPVDAFCLATASTHVGQRWQPAFVGGVCSVAQKLGLSGVPLKVICEESISTLIDVVPA